MQVGRIARELFGRPKMKPRDKAKFASFNVASALSFKPSTAPSESGTLRFGSSMKNAGQNDQEPRNDFFPHRNESLQAVAWAQGNARGWLSSGGVAGVVRCQMHRN